MTYSVHLVDLPPKVNATHCLNDDGSYSIFIDARCSDQQQREALYHELVHIRSEHLILRESADLYEYKVNKQHIEK